MKRRTFLRMMSAAVAVGMAPMLLNETRLQLAGNARRTFSFWGKGETISEIGIAGGGDDYIYERIILPEPIVVSNYEVLDITYEYSWDHPRKIRMIEATILPEGTSMYECI
jgi:hypothetical protein